MSMFTKEGFAKALPHFMNARCSVSSQHKLPSREEIAETAFASMFDKQDVQSVIDEFVAEGKLFVYGPYLSDRKIDVL